MHAKFQYHAGAATDVAVHPSGDLMVSVGIDKSYVLYDLHGSKVLTQVFTDSGEHRRIFSYREHTLTIKQSSPL